MILWAYFRARAHSLDSPNGRVHNRNIKSYDLCPKENFDQLQDEEQQQLEVRRHTLWLCLLVGELQQSKFLNSVSWAREIKIAWNVSSSGMRAQNSIGGARTYKIGLNILNLII